MAAAAFWFWHSRSESPTAAPGVAAQAPHTAAAVAARHARRLAPVQAATATTQAVPRYLSGLGTVTAANTVTVRQPRGWSTHRPALSGRLAKGQHRRSAGANRSQQFKVATAAQARRDSWRKIITLRWRMRVVIWRAISNWQKPIWFPVRNLDAQQALVNETEGNH